MAWAGSLPGFLPGLCLGWVGVAARGRLVGQSVWVGVGRLKGTQV